MLVVFLVAGVTLLGDLVLVQISGVAVLAHHFLVFPAQGVFGVGIVIEGGRLPLLVVVASLALLAVGALVALPVIDAFVAGITISGGFLVIVVLVAINTLHIGMFSLQREFGGVVVKTGLFPVVLGVTVTALGAKAGLVHIVFLVAGITIQGRFAVTFAAHMAFLAIGRAVFAFEHEVGLVVVKLLLVKVRNLRIAAFVVGVAGAAHRFGQAPVVTRLVAHVGPHILVAGHAQTILRLAVQFDVALFAVFLDLGMALDDLARRHDGFNALCRSGCGTDGQQHHAQTPYDGSKPSQECEHKVGFHRLSA